MPDAVLGLLVLIGLVLNSTINTLKRLAPIRGLQAYGITEVLTDADETFLDTIAERMTADDGTHRAFATIYDSKITLKKKYSYWLMKKSIANLALFVPPPWGYLTAAAGFVVHLKATAEITGIAKEWVILSALEEMVLRTKDIKTEVFERQLIPALAAHAELIAAVNQDSNTSTTDSLSGSLLSHSIQDSLDHIDPSVELATYPRPSVLQLPLEPEPAPILRSGPDEPEWDGHSNNQDDAKEINFDRIIRKHNNQVRKMNKRLRRLAEDLKQLDKQEKEVDRLIANATPDSQQTKDLNSETNEIKELRSSKRVTKTKLEFRLAKLIQEFDKFMKNIDQYESTLAGRSGNLSESPGHLPALLNQQQERHSQWVRATWPYVDALRAPILAQFENHLKRSNAKKHFIKWTNRYTLVKSWQFRAGYRFEKTGSNTGRWSKSSSMQPLPMYVMKDAYDRSGNEQKGREPWTGSSDDDKNAAEQLFTIVGLAHRSFAPQFAPQIFPVAHDRGMTTYAQAIIYNANPQASRTAEQTPLVQRNVGWDTLNWDPDTETPEWGSEPRLDSARWPWQIIASARQSDSVKVKLNWQAKLMPATQTRIEQAAVDNATNDMGKTLGLSALNFKEMSSH